MPKITFLNSSQSKQTFEVESGTTILDAAKQHGVPLEHACGGIGACSTCHVYIREGMDNLSEMTEDEADTLDTAVGITLESRLGCQSKVHGDVVVEI